MGMAVSAPQMGYGMQPQVQVIIEQPVGMGMGMGMMMMEPVGPGTQHPHVRPQCFHCNNTHRGICGNPFKCNHCVCVKCHGSGFNMHKGHACMLMEVYN
jgi:hypothetical protein